MSLRAKRGNLVVCIGDYAWQGDCHASLAMTSGVIEIKVLN
jgi:hypothetical protein